ncbi:MAG: aldose 1-epimerase family protein [Spirosomataceae bacterium]
MKLTDLKWEDKISNPSQMGGIETYVIDNGPGRGTRIAWINTGSGFRYKVVIDRGLDIADAFYNQYNLSWISHLGITPPQPFSAKGIDWLRTFGGGLLTTCGLSHVGGPESDEFGERGLHGHISNIPAELVNISQPDPLTGKLDFSITGIMRETKPFGPSLELHRTISGTLGSPMLRIQDKVINRGNTPAPHMLLNHFNFGWPLIDVGTDLKWEGDWTTRNGDRNGIIFKEGNSFKKAPAPLPSHNGSGEEVAFIDVVHNNGKSSCGLFNPHLQFGVTIRFNKSELPWLTNWQHWGKNEYVTGLEPGTHPPIGQAAARANGTLIEIQPGESRSYDLQVEIDR